MIENDLYKILDIEKDASEGDIKKAYKKLSKIHHPDKGGDEEEFKKISLAYSVLSDIEKRNNYDKYGVVDDSGNINIDDAATKCIIDISNGLLAQAEISDRCKSTDFIKIIRDILKKTNNEENDKTNNFEMIIKRLKIMEERIEYHKKGENLFKILINNRISGYIRQNYESKKKKLILMKATKLLENYSFKIDEENVNNIGRVRLLDMLNSTQFSSTTSASW